MNRLQQLTAKLFCKKIKSEGTTTKETAMIPEGMKVERVFSPETRNELPILQSIKLTNKDNEMLQIKFIDGEGTFGDGNDVFYHDYSSVAIFDAKGKQLDKIGGKWIGNTVSPDRDDDNPFKPIYDIARFEAKKFQKECDIKAKAKSEAKSGAALEEKLAQRTMKKKITDDFLR